MVQTCWNIKLYAVNTDIAMLRPTWMFMDTLDSMIAPINVHSNNKLKIIHKTWQQKHSVS